MILFAFFLCLIAFYLQMFTACSSLPILPFIPMIALSALLKPLGTTLLIAAGAGLLLDLFSADPTGIHALNYTLTAALLYRMRSRFDAEAPVQFCLYTALCSFVSTTLQIILLFLFDRRIHFPGKWWLAEWTLLPLFDAAYALLWFAGPLALLRAAKRIWSHYLLRRNENF